MSQTNSAEILPISIKKEMESSYLDYAMSVIVSRAIPDARDGLKPVHRRIIFSMNETGSHSNKPYRKSARIVGDVMGKYHPHGDSAIYDALVRMAQPFSMRLPLVDGQGNFGSMDGDSPAAMRYTESRMDKSAHALIQDIDKDTVDWQENYDGQEKEPTVLPARFPNLLVNGSAGIAVGMATNIPPHNLGEVIDGCCALIDNPETTIDEITEIIPAPDYPTGGIIMGANAAKNALQSGRGSIITRGKAEIVENGNKEAIIITEIPYMVNKASMVEKIALLVREKKLEGISDLRDESDKSGVRVVVELKRDAVGSVVLNQLFRYTQLQTSFGVNLLALDYGKPRQMNIKDVLEIFIKFRQEVVTRRTKFELNKARDRAHVLIGLSMAVDNIDKVISIIRSSPDVGTAKKRLMSETWNASSVEPLIKLVDDENNVISEGKCQFTEVQARAILEMRLSKLTGLEQEKITEELGELAEAIKDFLDILGDHARMMGIIRDELIEIKEQFATPRRTEIDAAGFEEDIEDLIAREDMVVTVTMGGYIKRVPLSTYRAQKRGGKGRSGLDLKEEDVTTEVFVTNTHTPLLFFSTTGKAYKMKTYKLPMGSPQSRGRSLMNVLPLEQGETVNVIMTLPEDEGDWDKLNIVFATKNGNIRRNLLSDFESVRANGKIGIKLDEGDALVNVSVAEPTQHILLATKQGKALRCTVDAVRVFKGRNSSGVRGINLAKGDEVISMQVINGVDIDSSKKTDYLRVSLEDRIEIAQILPSVYSPTHSLEGGENCQDSEGRITIETLRASQNPKTADRIEEIISSVENIEVLTADDFIEYARNEEFLLAITENGFGKRSSAFEYRITNRGGKGIVNIVTSERNGNVAASFPAFDGDQIMLVTDQGKLIRCPVDQIRVAGRNTQGVTIFKIGDNEKIVSAARIQADDEEDDGEELPVDSELSDNNEVATDASANVEDSNEPKEIE